MAPSFNGLEEHLKRIGAVLSGSRLLHLAKQDNLSVRRASKEFVIWQGKLFRRTPKGLVVISPVVDRVPILRFFHESMGHWDVGTTKKFLQGRVWWPPVVPDVYAFVRPCDDCQGLRPLALYDTTLHLPLMSLFQVFYIDFAGPFQVASAALAERFVRYILSCVEHLTSWKLARATFSPTSEAVIFRRGGFHALFRATHDYHHLQCIMIHFKDLLGLHAEQRN